MEKELKCEHCHFHWCDKCINIHTKAKSAEKCECYTPRNQMDDRDYHNKDWKYW